MMTPWCVYEDGTGIAWKCTPATKANAVTEAELVGEGHRAMTVRKAEELRNAWAHGRFAHIEQMRREGKL